MLFPFLESTPLPSPIIRELFFLTIGRRLQLFWWNGQLLDECDPKYFFSGKKTNEFTFSTRFINVRGTDLISSRKLPAHFDIA